MLENIKIVLVNTSHPGNIGAAARAMKNMGLSKLVLVDPKDHPTFESYSRAAGADDVLGDAVVVATLSEALKDCKWVVGTSARERYVQWPMMEPRACAEKSIEESLSGDVAIVFGRERTGLTNEELELCQSLVCIPTNPDYSSLNVAAAVQVLCYELRVASLAGKPDPQSEESSKYEDDECASADQVEGMYDHLYQMLDDIGFLGTSNPEIIMRRLKGMFSRARVTKREVNILRGIFSASQGRKSARKQ